MNNFMEDLFFNRLKYEPETGLFYWINSPRKWRNGIVAGYKRKDGYIVIRLNGNLYLAHRVAWFFVYGTWPVGIDHINGNTGDNRFVNLREAKSDENHWNMKLFVNNTSGYRGVTYHRKTGKWVAEIWHKRKKYYLGLFNTKEMASEAHELARSRMFGDFNRVTQEQIVNIE